WELIQLLSRLRDKRGRVRIPGFYKRVKPPTREELKSIREIRIDYKRLMQQLGIREVRHKTAYQALRELVFEPTCNIAGLASGHVGKGAKTITPSLASVKIDFRLVPGQRPEEVLESLRRFVKRFGDFDINVYTMLPPARCRPGSPVVKAAVEAAVEIYGVKPNVFPSMYGTGPLASIVKHGIDAGMLNSISNPESNLHAPNENIMKKDLMRSTLQLASMFRRLAT
ncbi:MAG TPA: M20/M25/M40 family metallo-hydrolase, partial [Aigarchaeota archaeon]|nr:M20/M25/M40 family metallo-hydrolase [Aigarchaeota archaeon]